MPNSYTKTSLNISTNYIPDNWVEISSPIQFSEYPNDIQMKFGTE